MKILWLTETVSLLLSPSGSHPHPACHENCSQTVSIIKCLLMTHSGLPVTELCPVTIARGSSNVISPGSLALRLWASLITYLGLSFLMC